MPRQTAQKQRVPQAIVSSLLESAFDACSCFNKFIIDQYLRTYLLKGSDTIKLKLRFRSTASGDKGAWLVAFTLTSHIKVVITVTAYNALRPDVF